MARHAENCSGEVEDAENGAPTPKKGKRGKKRKMRSRRDEEDSGECLMFYGSVGMISVQVCDLMSFMYLCHSEEDHAEPDEEEEGEEEASLLQEEEEAESMELDQAPAAIPINVCTINTSCCRSDCMKKKGSAGSVLFFSLV